MLPIVGALVIEEGGAMCRAPIVAREVGIPAVIGAPNATAVISHGAHIEVAPIPGTVRLI